MKKQRTFFYIFIIIGIVFVSIIALILNIKTDPINKEISQINKQIALLKKENSQLMLTHTSLNTLDIIEKKAKQLGLKKSDVNSMQHVVLKP